MLTYADVVYRCVVSLVSPEKLEAVKAALSAKYKDMFAGKECHHITSDACAGLYMYADVC
jgi:hypothetical protein